MLKQKSENCMSNKLCRPLLSVFFILQLVACSVTPDGEKTYESSGSTVKGKNYLAAVTAMKSGNLNEARNLFLDVINKQPNLANAHVNIGIIFSKNESLAEAENAFNRALEIDPKNIYALNQLGYLYRKQGEFSKAKASYEKSIDINSGYAYAHLNLGILYDIYMYDLKNAIKHYKIYNELLKVKDKQVEKWLFDLERRHNKAVTKK